MIDRSTGSGRLLDESTADDLGEIRFRRVRDVGDIINITFRFLRDNFRELGTGMLYIVGPLALGAAVLSFFVQSQMHASMFDFTNMSNDPLEVYQSIFTPAYAAYIGLLMVVQLLVSVVVLGYVRLYREGLASEIPPGVLWAEASGMIIPLVLLSLFIFGLATMSLLVWIVPCLGALAWLVAIVYLMPSLSMSVVSRTLEQDSAWSALKRPYELVKGHWGLSFGTVAIAGIAFMAVVMLLSIPGMMIGFGSMMGTLNGDDPGEVSRVLLAVASVLSTLTYVGYVIPIVASTFLYFNLIERKEGAGLFSDIDLIGAEVRDVDVTVGQNLPKPPPVSPSHQDGTAPGGFRGGGFEGGSDA